MPTKHKLFPSLFLRMTGGRRSGDVPDYFTIVNAPWVSLGNNRYEIDGSQVSNTNLVTDAGAVTNGLTYYCTVEVVRCDAGWVRWVLGSTSAGTQRSTTGTFVESIVAVGGTFVYLQANALFDGEVRVTSNPVVEVTIPEALGLESASEIGTAIFASMGSPVALSVESVSEIGIVSVSGLTAPAATGLESVSEIGVASPPSAYAAPNIWESTWDDSTLAVTFSVDMDGDPDDPTLKWALHADGDSPTNEEVDAGTGFLETGSDTFSGGSYSDTFTLTYSMEREFPYAISYIVSGNGGLSNVVKNTFVLPALPVAEEVESVSEIGTATVSAISAPAATGVESASDIGDAYVLDTMGLIRQDMESRVDPFIGTGTGEAPGIAVGFVGEGSDEFSFGRGLKSIGGPVVDGDTLFCLGSVTKTLTGYAFAKAKVDGDLGWATLANTWLDSTPDDIRIHSSIDLRMLASHTSGLPTFPDNMGDDLTEPDLTQQPGKNYTKAKWAADIAAGGSDPLYVPGSNQSYSNLGFAALSIVMQNKFSYADDDELLDTKVFTPLGMTKTSSKTTTFLTTNADDLAQGYESDLTEAPFPDMGILAGAGEFISSANDMMIFVRELAERSSSYSQEMEVDISGPQAAIGYGHGISTTTDGEDLRTKGGSTAAYTCAIAWRENPNLGVVVLTNRGGLTTIVQLAEDLLDDAVARLAVQTPTGVESASEVGTASVLSISAPAATGVESASEVGTASPPATATSFTMLGDLYEEDNLTTYTFTAQTEANVICVVGRQSGAALPVSVTMNGKACTYLDGSAVEDDSIAFYSCPTADGSSTGSLVITFAGQQQRAFARTAYVEGFDLSAESASAFDMNNDNVTGSLSLDCPAGGVIFAVARLHTFAGDLANDSAGSNGVPAAWEIFAGAQTGFSITLAGTASANQFGGAISLATS